jgi:hypothetical protein
LRTHLAILSSLCAVIAISSRPAPAADNDVQILTYFLLEEAVAREYVDKCSRITPSPLKEDYQATYASHLLQLTQAQRILENQRPKSETADHAWWLTRQQSARKDAADFVDKIMRADPVRECRAYFRMLRRQPDALVIAQRTAKVLDRLDARIRSLQQSPPQQER